MSSERCYFVAKNTRRDHSLDADHVGEVPQQPEGLQEKKKQHSILDEVVLHATCVPAEWQDGKRVTFGLFPCVCWLTCHRRLLVILTACCRIIKAKIEEQEI